MDLRTKNPVTVARDGVPKNIKAFDPAFDLENPTETLSQSLAVRRTAERYRISPTHARVVCELYGLGGAV